MVFQTAGVPRILVNAEASDELVLCPHLDVVAWFQLAISHTVFFHPHESGIFVCF